MPYLLRHPQSRWPRRRVAVASAVIVAVALAAAGCASAPSTPVASVAAEAVSIAGAGSTFDAPFFTAAFAAHQQAHLGVAVSYAAVGSGAGIARFAAGQTNFGATDVPASPADLAGASGTTLQVPVDLGAVAVAYNAITNGSGPLRLTGPVIARIFLGQITKWDDPAIQALNPGTELPDGTLSEQANPPDYHVYAGCFPGLAVVCGLADGALAARVPRQPVGAVGAHAVGELGVEEQFS
jgi:ABC-type phosphate transport system substrate-binding protein